MELEITCRDGSREGAPPPDRGGLFWSLSLVILSMIK
jgi:hypothetical protein